MKLQKQLTQPKTLIRNVMLFLTLSSRSPSSTFLVYFYFIIKPNVLKQLLPKLSCSNKDNL